MTDTRWDKCAPERSRGERAAATGRRAIRGYRDVQFDIAIDLEPEIE